MASERAKELAAKQKAEIKAEKLRKKNSTDPRDWGYFRQIKEVYKTTAKDEPKTHLLVIGSTVLVAVAIFGLAIIIGGGLKPLTWMWLPLALMTGVLVGMLILMRLAKRAALARSKGQIGSAQTALGMLNDKKYTVDLGVAATRELDLVHRVIGPGGIVLIGEGAPGRTRALMAQAVRRYEQVSYGTPVTQIMLGDAANQVSLNNLQKHIEKMPKVLEKYQITEVLQRSKALDLKSAAPVPKGPLPTPKGVNRSLRRR